MSNPPSPARHTSRPAPKLPHSPHRMPPPASHALRDSILILLALLLATAAHGLPLENDLLVYQEDFEGESTLPTMPEVDQIGSGGSSSFGVPGGISPTLANGAVDFELTPITSGGDYYQQISIPPGDLAIETVGLRSSWSNPAFAPDTTPIFLGTSAGGSTATTVFSAFALLEVDWTTPGVRPAVRLLVGDAVGIDPDTIEQSFVSDIFSDSLVDRMLASDSLVIDLKVDHTQLAITGSIAIDGTTVMTLGPKSFVYVGGDPFQEFRAVFSSATSPASSVSVDQRVSLTDFEVFRPFSEVYVVDTSADEVDLVPGDGQCETASTTCTLRAAVQESNANPGPSRITFLSLPLPIGLNVAGADEDAAATGDLDVLDDLVIRGRGIDDTVIDGLLLDRVFHVPQSATDTVFELSDLTVRHGDASTATSRAGGGIDSWGNTTIRRCAIEDNEAGYGGGLFNRRQMRLIDSRVVGNQAVALAAGGGGRAGGLGGGVFGGEGTLDPTIEIIRSAVAGNYAALAIGGAEFLGADSVLIENSTFTSNTSGGFDRGLQLTNSDAVLRHVTLVGDTALGVGSTGTPVSIEITNTVVYGDATACSLTTNPAVSYLYSGNNASNDTSCGFTGAGDIEGQSLGLDPAVPLGDSYGHPPDATSPLRDAADPAFCFGDIDQVGTLRPLDSDADGTSVCELGAIEVPEPGHATLLAAGIVGLGIARRRRAMR